ncbi:MAG TPA: helix-turn-helix domain-containing protein [Gemmatimonadales bacterium]|jgi:predicted ArsR family transcriptional regulator|nr:helix-turn-helix domain-containing protein [Gemmatimonadales bacterium]
MIARGLGESQQAILALLKRGGQGTIPDLAAEVGLNIETVRGHLKSLVGAGLVRREGTQRRGPGRPEVRYGLTPAAEALFPRREGETLRDLAAHLVKSGKAEVLREFFERRIGGRRADALARVRDLRGRARVAEVARIFSELGFMAVVEDDDGVPRLRLCHCPIRELVQATRIPCAAEIGLIKALLGEEMSRVSYIPSGDNSCAYRVGA